MRAGTVAIRSCAISFAVGIVSSDCDALRRQDRDRRQRAGRQGARGGRVAGAVADNEQCDGVDDGRGCDRQDEAAARHSSASTGIAAQTMKSDESSATLLAHSVCIGAIRSGASIPRASA